MGELLQEFWAAPRDKESGVGKRAQKSQILRYSHGSNALERI
jgi:hypothetical protein